MITLKDANGEWVCINEVDLMEVLSMNKLTIFGMDMNTIAELRSEYLKRGGNVVITEESVKEIFSN